MDTRILTAAVIEVIDPCANKSNAQFLSGNCRFSARVRHRCAGAEGLLEQWWGLASLRRLVM